MTEAITSTDAHQRVLRWAYVLTLQVDRLYEARKAALESQERIRLKRHYAVEDAKPFHLIEAEKHFTLVAARQLLRALQAFDGDDRLPAAMPAARLRDVRDALEHWDEPAGRAATRLRKAGADPDSHRWSTDGSGVLSDLVSDADLRVWSQAVYDELWGWDPGFTRPSTAP